MNLASGAKRRMRASANARSAQWRWAAPTVWQPFTADAILPAVPVSRRLQMNDKPGSEHARDRARIDALRKLEETLRRDAWERALADLARTSNKPPAASPTADPAPHSA